MILSKWGGMDDEKSVMDEKETNYWPTLLLLLWIGLPERLQISYLPPIRVFNKNPKPYLQRFVII